MKSGGIAILTRCKLENTLADPYSVTLPGYRLESYQPALSQDCLLLVYPAVYIIYDIRLQGSICNFPARNGWICGHSVLLYYRTPSIVPSIFSHPLLRRSPKPTCSFTRLESLAWSQEGFWQHSPCRNCCIFMKPLLTISLPPKGFINRKFLQELRCQKSCWDKARLSSLVKKQVGLGLLIKRGCHELKPCCKEK